MNDVARPTSLFLNEWDISMGRTNPTAHDIQIKIFEQVSNEEVLSNLIISSSKTLM